MTFSEIIHRVFKNIANDLIDYILGVIFWAMLIAWIVQSM